TRSEKGKWVAGSATPVRRAPIRIPPSNNAELIEDNKLTLLGRVTNPFVQKPKWVLDWL
ncbi:unnamed protein product, partial [Brassica oleracea var. botrytis]